MEKDGEARGCIPVSPSWGAVSAQELLKSEKSCTLHIKEFPGSETSGSLPEQQGERAAVHISLSRRGTKGQRQKQSARIPSLPHRVASALSLVCSIWQSSSPHTRRGWGGRCRVIYATQERKPLALSPLLLRPLPGLYKSGLIPGAQHS